MWRCVDGATPGAMYTSDLNVIKVTETLIPQLQFTSSLSVMLLRSLEMILLVNAVIYLLLQYLYLVTFEHFCSVLDGLVELSLKHLRHSLCFSSQQFSS